MKPILKTYLSALVSLLLITLIVLFKPNDMNVSSGKQCNLDKERVCYFDTNQEQTQQVIVKFSGKVQVEELNQLQVLLPAGYIIEKTWIQGINMYMGQIAVFADAESAQTSQSDEHHLQFFLGACSEPNMRWQLVLVTKKVSNQQPETFFINFTTELS